MLRSFILAGAALLAASCASAPGGEAANSGNRDCFNADNVTGYSYIDEHTVSVRVGVSRTYLLTTDWNARDLDWGTRIALRSPTDWICVGNGLGVQVIGGEPRRNYFISRIERAPETTPSDAAPQGS